MTDDSRECRILETRDGKSLAVAFDASTWHAIGMLACAFRKDQDESKWTVWANDLIDHADMPDEGWTSENCQNLLHEAITISSFNRVEDAESLERQTMEAGLPGLPHLCAYRHPEKHARQVLITDPPSEWVFVRFHVVTQLSAAEGQRFLLSATLEDGTNALTCEMHEAMARDFLDHLRKVDNLADVASMVEAVLEPKGRVKSDTKFPTETGAA